MLALADGPLDERASCHHALRPVFPYPTRRTLRDEGMAERGALCGSGKLAGLERCGAGCGAGHCDNPGAVAPAITGRGERHAARDGAGHAGGVGLLDALAGATTLVHLVVRGRLCVAIAVVRSRAREHAAAFSEAGAPDGAVDKPPRWV